jgi:hypothetical protein
MSHVTSHPLRITERDVIKEQSLDEWFNSFKGLDLHVRVGGDGSLFMSLGLISVVVCCAVLKTLSSPLLSAEFANPGRQFFACAAPASGTCPQGQLCLC